MTTSDSAPSATPTAGGGEPDIEMGPATDGHEILHDMRLQGIRGMYNQLDEDTDVLTACFYDVLEATTEVVRRKYGQIGTNIVVTAGDMDNLNSYQIRKKAGQCLLERGI